MPWSLARGAKRAASAKSESASAYRPWSRHLQPDQRQGAGLVRARLADALLLERQRGAVGVLRGDVALGQVCAGAGPDQVLVLADIAGLEALGREAARQQRLGAGPRQGAGGFRRDPAGHDADRPRNDGQRRLDSVRHIGLPADGRHKRHLRPAADFARAGQHQRRLAQHRRRLRLRAGVSRVQPRSPTTRCSPGRPARPARPAHAADRGARLLPRAAEDVDRARGAAGLLHAGFVRRVAADRHALQGPAPAADIGAPARASHRTPATGQAGKER